LLTISFQTTKRMAGGSASLSQLVLLFVTICLISFASFVYFTSFRHPEQAGKIVTNQPDQLYNDLVTYVKTLEEAVRKKEHQLLGYVENNPADGAEGHQPPKYENPIHSASREVVSLPSQPVANKPEMLNDAATTEWISKLSSKLLCLRLKKGGIYLYHTRKAAGTSIRDILTYIAAKWHVPYYETEGVVMHPDLMKKSGLLTVTSLREPVSRIMSLYWYEHVGWYSGVLKQTERCKSLKTWVDAWRDGSQWKDEFIAKNPDSVYVEIDNYYTKMLSNWHARQANNNNKAHMRGVYNGKYARVTEADLEIAKNVLGQFDIVFLSDWMGDSTQMDALNSVFPGEQALMCVCYVCVLPLIVPMCFQLCGKYTMVIDPPMPLHCSEQVCVGSISLTVQLASPRNHFFTTGRVNIAAGHKVRGDHNAKMKLVATLAPDEVKIYLCLLSAPVSGSDLF